MTFTSEEQRREVARKQREPKESLLAYPADELIRLRHVADIASYIGLPPRGVDAE